MPETLSALQFIQKHHSERLLLLDVRSEKEFAQGHMPGAVNIPLLNDDHRRQVGITYKSNGKDAAVLKGFDLVGEKFSDFIREVKKLTAEKHVMLYCWRGGMRSGIMSWVLGMGGFKTFLLKGGYKAYRQAVFEILQEPRNVVVVGGKTGSGKTEVLAELKKMGAQVICLETLASHRGSAFGALGMPPQPRNEMFQNMLAGEWMNVESEKTLFLENESLTIGPILLPKGIYEAIRNSPVVELLMSKAQRTKRIVDEYGRFPVENLIENTQKLSKRLGGLRTRQAIEALEQGDKAKWVDEILNYYDQAYQYGNDTKKVPNVDVEVNENESVSSIAVKVLSAARSFKS
ncbi:MAG: tRNA 2-selenouridine(34) synthase MnmH [Bacteroidetes bacterium]|nr:tRNA 2-selenouridine(34) synthase MnmH [Bacteroidota bacterium]